MNRKLLLLVVLLCSVVVYGIDEKTSALSFSPADMKFPVDYTGYAFGQCGDTLLITGGVGEVGKDVYVLPYDEDKWQKKSLDQGVLYAASVSVDGKVILIGGISDGKVTDNVKVFSFNDGELIVDLWPKLPEPRAYSGAAVLDDKLYVVGGIDAVDSSQASQSVFCMDLTVEPKAWNKFDDIGGVGRIRPAVIGLYSELHVFGGQEIIAVQGGYVARSLADAWGYREKPLDGTTTRGWRRFTDMLEPLAGSGVFQTGQTHVAIVGGFTGDSEFSHVSRGIRSQVSGNAYIYHNVTDTWIEGGKLPIGAGAINTFTRDDSIVLAGGIGADFVVLTSVWDVKVNTIIKQLAIGDYSVIIVYLLLMAGIGLYFATKQKSSDEFALGNRKVKWWAAAVSMFATGASSISFMAIPAQSFRTNLIWLTPVLLIVPLYPLQAYVIFPILRRLRLTSTYEYLEQRFSSPLRYVASAQCIAMQLLGRMSIVLLLPSLAISAVTGLDVFVSVLVMGLLTTVYTSFGGFEAVIWTDFVQGMMMIFGMILMIILAVTGLPGGISEFFQTGFAYDKFDLVILDFDYTLPIIWVYAVWQVFIYLAFASDQPTAQRVLSTPLKDVRKLSAMFIFYGILIAVLVNIAGVAMFSYFHANPTMLDPQMTNDQVVPLFIIQRLPTGVAGLIVAAIFAASMSTLSSSMNSVATISCEDFYRKLNPNSTDRSRLVFMKIASFLTGLIGTGVAFYMASMNLRSMFQVWNEVMALLGGGFLGIYILGMFTRRANTTGAIIGAFASIVCVLYIKNFTQMHWIFYNPLAIGSCIAVGYLTSIVMPGKRKDMSGLTVFDLVKDEVD